MLKTKIGEYQPLLSIHITSYEAGKAFCIKGQL